MEEEERAEWADVARRLTNLRQYVRDRWNEQRAKDGVGPISFEAMRRSMKQIEEDRSPLPFADGTIQRDGRRRKAKIGK